MLINIIYGIFFGSAVYFIVAYFSARKSLNSMNYIEVRNAQIEEDLSDERKIPLAKRFQIFLSSYGYSGNYLPLLAGVTLVYLITSLLLTLLKVGSLIGVLISLPISLILTFATLSSLKKKTVSKFDRQLLQVLSSVVNYLEAGDVPTMAFQKAVRLVDDPLRSSFEAALATKMGSDSLADVLSPLEEEYPSRSMTLLITALKIDDKVGAKLAPALRQAQSTLEKQFELGQEGKAEIAQAQSEFYVITVIMFSIALFLIVGTGELTRNAYLSPIGLIMLAFALLNYGLGVYRALKIFSKAGRV